MNSAGLTDSQLRALRECVANGRMGLGITYAGSTLFLYDYVLTFGDEVRYVWRPKRIAIGSVAFFLARYCAMAATIIVLLPNSDNISGTSNSANVLRLVSIIASEVIIAVRTWAIWGRSFKILLALVAFSLAAVIPAAYIVSESVITSRVVALVSEQFIDVCSLSVESFEHAFVAPYVLAILYESVTLTFSLVRILNWRKNIPKNIRTPLIDNLWRDGVLYFSFMLVLGFINIGIVLQQGIPEIRTASAELQAVIHSVLSTRIVMHLAKSKYFGDITAPGSSVYERTTIQFRSRFHNTSALSTRGDTSLNR
ncbi:hypothetical protein GYMLUDRAFT_379369 [Collybiopsis luxurians FD-317 M1]|nr:hypothetical protein GYMLUDRAFT_379369 [Collybiopsis luxurians FD-317 M1]